MGKLMRSKFTSLAHEFPLELRTNIRVATMYCKHFQNPASRPGNSSCVSHRICQHLLSHIPFASTILINSIPKMDYEPNFKYNKRISKVWQP